MKLAAAEMLRGLGTGRSISEVCADAAISREQFNAWWDEECRKRVPSLSGERRVRIKSEARIDRDRWGIPHIVAKGDAELFFALGYANAQDRLFQLDYTRRKATGRLAEVLGADAVASDTLYRTLDLTQIAAAEWVSLPEETRSFLQAYADGINAWMKVGAALPMEFDLLDYVPEPWSPENSLEIEGEFRWYLTGRLPVLAIPEILKRSLGDGPLYHAALTAEAGDESILWHGDYRAANRYAASGPDGDGGSNPSGSNNWVVAPSRSTTGKPLMAGDPHLPYGAVSLWYEARLHGGSFNIAGVMLSGMPAIMVGRTPQTTWTITNNICSLRDLYLEQTSAEHPNHFLYDGKWEPAHERHEQINVKGGERVETVIRSSRNGPIVDALLPEAARDIGPVALRWVGQQTCGWLTALLGMDRAKSVSEFFEATRPWICPTFNVLCADTDGHIGLQTTGRIPVRELWERGFRPGWDPRHQWTGLVNFEDMPRLYDPPRGYIVTANNRLAPDDYPFPLNCTSTSGHRARRIRQEIERLGKLSPEDCQKMQLDVLTLRGAECVPPLVALLGNSTDERVRQATKFLRDWDFSAELSSVATTILNAFFPHWCRAVAHERLVTSDHSAESRAKAVLASERLGGLAVRLLASDPLNWFHRHDRAAAIAEAFHATLDELTGKLGHDMSTWRWERIHLLLQPHFLSGRGDLGTLLDISGVPTRGDGTTICSSTPNTTGAAYTGAGQRMMTDLADPGAGIWTIEAGSISGNPGSPHYRDQLQMWSAGELRYLSLAGGLATAEIQDSLHLRPREEASPAC